MKSKPFCVFDTNSLISALLSSASISRTAFDKALDHYQLVVSNETMAEFNDVAGREKFRPYLTEEEKDGFIELLYRESHLVQVSETVEACRDPDDNKFLELAVTVNAQVIVTGESGPRRSGSLPRHSYFPARPVRHSIPTATMSV